MIYDIYLRKFKRFYERLKPFALVELFNLNTM